MANRATDFTYPASLTSTGGAVTCNITLKPYSSSNRNSIYVAYGSGSNAGSYSLCYNKVGPGTYSITVPASAFNKTNAYMTIQIDSYTSSGTFISGSFAHTVLLFKSGYTNNLYTCSIPDRTFPMETCSVNIVNPKDLSSGQYCEVSLNYNRAVGIQTIASNRTAGWFNFTTPELATNSSMTIRITTRNKSGSVLGIVAQSMNIKQPEEYRTTHTTTTSTSIPAPTVTVPALAISEGAPIQFKGTSHNLKDYMVVYAKQPCDVSKAIADYNGELGYFSATATELKNKLLGNVYDSPSYYVLKPFDQTSSFITQDENNRNVFHIRTPDTNDYKNSNDLYLMQWFQGVEPGDLVYIYIIEKGTRTVTTITTTTYNIPAIYGKTKTMIDPWRCRWCNSTAYYYWYHVGSYSTDYSPYTRIDLAQTRQFLYLYEYVPASAVFVLNMDTTLDYPPELFITSYSGTDNMSVLGRADYLTPLNSGRGKTFRYSVPISLLQEYCFNDYSAIYVRTSWGRNTDRYAYFSSNCYLEVTASQYAESRSWESNRETRTETYYTDAKYTNINSIPLSSMKPVAVIPPAVRPVEITLKENNVNQVTIDYTNPLYGTTPQYAFEYKDLEKFNIDVSEGDNKNDYSSLNDIDPTLDINSLEERYTTYEKRIPLSSDLLNKIKNSKSEIFVDLLLESIEENVRVNFKDITNRGAKIQLMLSNDGQNISKLLEITSDSMDIIKDKYSFEKFSIDKNLFINNNFNTLHLLYNTDEYIEGTVFDTVNWSLYASNGKILQEIGWKPLGNRFTLCNFNIDTFSISRKINDYGQSKSKVRLRLENLKFDKELYSQLFEPPTIKVSHREITRGNEKVTETTLVPEKAGSVYYGEDIFYDIPYDIFDVGYDEIIEFTLSAGDKWRTDTPLDINFSNAIVEVIRVENIFDEVDLYATGFNATINFFERITGSNSATSFDPVECIDVIMCCYDANKNLINKTANKRRDIYNGKEMIYYSDRKWHNFVCDKYKNNPKHKESYSMIFNVPNGTEYMHFMAFTYGNWFGNPSVYSMSNILAVNSIKKEIDLEFISPTPIQDVIDPNLIYATTELNNPEVKIKVHTEKDSSMSPTNNFSSGFNLAKDTFDRNKWLASPIIYSNTKTYGYEQPVFNNTDAYNLNNVILNTTPLYNNIEHYNRWKNLYGKDIVYSPSHDPKSDVIVLNSNYTVYEDEGDKFISNNSIAYIDIPKEIMQYDRSKITLFLDADFGKNI